MGCFSSPAAYENCLAPAQGLQPYGAIGNGQLDAWIAAAVAQSKPPGAPSTYALACEANLRARGILYDKKTPGDCGSAGSAPSGFTPAQIVGLSGSASGGVIGGLGSAGIIGGAATLGITSAISIAVGAIEGIFAHHAQAVANEQNTICQVANYFNPLMAKIDAAVRSGQISADEGITYLGQVILSATNGLASIVKTCNAACVYQAILKAHLYFAKNFYPSIAPVSVYPQNPGSSPDGYGTPPGGVTIVGNNPAPPQTTRSLPGNTYAPGIPGSAHWIASNNLLPGNPNAPDYLNRGYNQQTGDSAQYSDVPPQNNMTLILALIGIIILVLVLR